MPPKTILDLSPEELAGARPLSSAAASPSSLTAEALRRLELGEDAAAPPAEGAAAAAAEQRQQAAGAATCIACGVGVGAAPGFGSVAEQRAHFRTDWHRLNLKRRLAGLPSVSEDQFAALADQDELGSLSASSSDSEGEDGLQPAAAGAGPGAAAGRSPQLQFALPSGRRYATWRCLLAPDSSSSGSSSGNEAAPSDATSLAQLAALRAAGTARWAVVLLRGGHFAAAVFEVTPQLFAVPGGGGGGGKQGSAGAKLEAVAHKSVHRYVVRWVSSPAGAERGAALLCANKLRKESSTEPHPLEPHA